MRLTTAQYLDILNKQERNKLREAPPQEPVDREADLHRQIIDFCNSQWPRWKYIHCRMDRETSIDVGAPDFIIFAPKSQTIALECKAKGNKLSLEQNIWIRELNLLNHTCHVVYNFDQFLAVVDLLKKTRRPSDERYEFEKVTGKSDAGLS